MRNGLLIVVVGAGVQQRDFVGLGMACRQHDDRHGGPPANLGAHVESCAVGKPKIQHDEVWVIDGRDVDPLPRGSRLEYPRGKRSERLAERAPNL